MLTFIFKVGHFDGVTRPGPLIALHTNAICTNLRKQKVKQTQLGSNWGQPTHKNPLIQKEKTELPEEWKYKVVFQMQDAEEKKLEPIFVYEVEDKFYFEWKNKIYLIDGENRDRIISEFEEHFNPQPTEEIE